MSRKSLIEAAKQRPSFMEVLHLLPPYTVDDVINAYQTPGVKKGGGRSPFEYQVTTIANAQLLSATAGGGDQNSRLKVALCE